LISAFNVFDISNRCYQVAVIKSVVGAGWGEEGGILENKFWLKASAPNYGQVCR